MIETTSLPRLDRPQQAEEHLRFILSDQYLDAPTVLIVACDGHARPIYAVHVVECELDVTPTEGAAVLDNVFRTLVEADLPVIEGLCLALTRPGGEATTAYDKAWFRALHRVSAQRGVSAVGLHVVTRTSMRTVHHDDAA